MAPYRPARQPVMPLLLVALLALTGCGASSGLFAAGTFPATATHEYGTTVVPKSPRRVVSLGPTDQDAILALDTVPIAIREFTGHQPSATWPWAADRLRGEQPKVLPAAGVTPEALAELRPDLIVAITAGLTREQYDAFSRVAPTVAAPAGTVDGAVPWQDATRLTGAALGVPEAADRLVTQVEGRFVKAEQAHPELAGATVAAVRAGAAPASFTAWSSKDRRGRFLTELGMQLPGEVEQRAGQDLSVTMPTEQLRGLDRADVLVVVGTEAERSAFAALPGYGRLNLVQRSKVVTLDDQQSAALSFGSVLSLPSVVDDVTGRIARAVQR
jgi:iron complex transport system substrate-binding protein